jgi:hypothetical protein
MDEKKRLMKLANDLDIFAFNYISIYTEADYTILKKAVKLIKKAYEGK